MRFLLASLILAAAAPAHADVFKLAAEVDAGAVYGTGYAGDATAKQNAFFAKAPPFAFGATVSGELFGFADAYIQHDEFTDGHNLTTWTQFGVGLHMQPSLADPKAQAQGKGAYAELGFAVFFGLGTGQEIVPPLDNGQISDKGFLAEGRIGLGTHLNRVVDLGIAVPVSWGYFFKNGPGLGANDTNNQYQGVQGEVFGYVRFNIHLL